MSTAESTINEDKKSYVTWQLFRKKKIEQVPIVLSDLLNNKKISIFWNFLEIYYCALRTFSKK